MHGFWARCTIMCSIFRHKLLPLQPWQAHTILFLGRCAVPIPVPPSPLLYCTVGRKIMVLIYGKENILERKCRKEETFWFLCNFYIKYIGIYVCIRWSGASSVLVHLTSERQGFDSRFCFKHNKNYIVADPRDPDSESGSCLNWKLYNLSLQKRLNAF